MNFENLPDLISPQEFVAWSGLSRSTVYEALRRGELPSIRVGRRIFLPKPAVARQFGLVDSHGVSA